MRRMKIVGIAIVAPCLMACAARSRSFHPDTDETVSGGYRAIAYELVPDDARWGEARVWSRGARLDPDSGIRTTIVHVGCEIQNRAAAPLSLAADKTFLRIVTKEKGPALTVNLLEGREWNVAPHGKETFDLSFAVPNLTPSSIESFELHWSIVRGRDRFSEITAFAPGTGNREVVVYEPFPFRPYYWGGWRRGRFRY